ncbi:sensor histidine kinase [Methylomarinum vadi]|uniref:sensor histidine kinase n=1 Tax=Methylomarinum vadi TaxID=438855 RepID=UPI0004DF2C88|nr:sensor histidine kinase [Methylomarinum vadi]
MPTQETLRKRLWQVRWRLLGNFVPFAAIAVTFAAIIGKMQVEEAMLNLRTAEVNAVARGVTAITRGMDHMPRDIRFLYLLNDIPAIVSKPSAPVLRQLEAIFIAFLNASGTYSQARWIDATGQERVRVDHNGEWTWIVPYNTLQMKKHRYYFQEAMRLPNHGIFISPMDLNIEHRNIAIPYEPTLRVATPVVDQKGRRQGILILNQNMSDDLFLLTNFGVNSTITLVNEQGFWLKGEHKSDEWGHSLDKPELSLAFRHPEAWRKISRQKLGQFEIASGLWTFRRVEMMPDKLISSADHLLNYPRLTVISKIPTTKLVELRRGVMLPTLSMLCLTIIALFFLSASRALSWQARNSARQLIKARAKELGETNARLEQAYANLRLTQDELIRSEKLSALGLMVSGVAHEINTPLGAALVAVSKTQSAGQELAQRFSEGLRRSDLESYLKLQDEGLSLASRNLEKAAKLVNSFKQLAVDRASEDRQRFNLDELVNECLLLFRTPAKRANIELITDVELNIEMNSYPGPLSQILHNLIDNAMVHAFKNRPGGRINIYSGKSNEPGFIRLNVDDNGNGIDPHTIQKIFDPFFTTRRGEGGMGLGLHISHHIAKEVLGANLNVTSSPERGTCFTLDMPLRAPGHPENSKENI